MTQEKMIDFYNNEIDKEKKKIKKRKIEKRICDYAILFLWLAYTRFGVHGFVSIAWSMVAVLFMDAFVYQRAIIERQTSSLKIDVFSNILDILKQKNLSKQQLQAIDNIMIQTMVETSQIVSADLDDTAHGVQLRQVYKTYYDKIQRVLVSDSENTVINDQVKMDNNVDESKVSEQLAEPHKETNIRNFEPKNSIQLKLTEILMKKGLTVEQAAHLLSTYSKNDYPTLIALLETNMISSDILQENFSRENPTSLIDDRIKKEYTELIENAQTKEGKQAMQKRYYQDLLNKYLENTIPDSKENFTKKKMR